jgi:3-hydroxyisobutyrate dehydrogenase-like beta-hydroxyacid dehydrogenase
MRSMRVLAVLHTGAMGAAVAACLVGRGHEVGWLRTGRSDATLRRAARAGLTPFDDFADLPAHADIVFSICPPHGALDVPRAPATFGGIVVDANAISPETSLLIGRTITGGGRYVDGGIIGPPPSQQARRVSISRATTARSRTCSRAQRSTRSTSPAKRRPHQR